MTWRDDFTADWNANKPSAPWVPKFERYWLARLAALSPPPPAPSPTGLSPIAPPVGPFTEKVGGSVGVALTAYELLDRGVREVGHFYAHSQTSNNIQMMAWRDGEAKPVSPPVEAHDLVCEDAARPTPLSSNGTAESNLWVGCSANVARVEMRRGAWMGMFTGGNSGRPDGGCYRSTFEDIRLTEQRIGIYIEHVTRECIFRRLHIEAALRGINVEWWYSGRGSHSCLIEDSYIEISGEKDNRAILLDAGTYGFSLRNLVIPRGVIELPNKRVVPDLPNTVENCRRPDGTPLTVENGGVVFHDRAIGA